MDGPLKVARTFIENEPEQFGIYAPRVPGGRFNGELLALCEKETNANLFAAAPELLAACIEAHRQLEDSHADMSWVRGERTNGWLKDVIAKATGGKQ